MWGRLGPLWASLVATSVIWWLLHPHYSRLLIRLVPLDFTPRVLAWGSLVAFLMAAIAGEIGLLASARSARGSTAVMTAALGFVLAVGLPLLIFRPFIPVLAYWGQMGPRVAVLSTLGALLAGCFYVLWSLVWAALVAAVDRC
jgi:hypothetical protein